MDKIRTRILFLHRPGRCLGVDVESLLAQIISEIFKTYGPIALFLLAWYQERQERQKKDEAYMALLPTAIAAMEGTKNVLSQVVENTKPRG